MYNHERYFTVTGKIYGEVHEVEERSKEFLEVYERYFGEESESSAHEMSPKKSLRACSVSP